MIDDEYSGVQICYHVVNFHPMGYFFCACGLYIQMWCLRWLTKLITIIKHLVFIHIVCIHAPLIELWKTYMCVCPSMYYYQRVNITSSYVISAVLYTIMYISWDIYIYICASTSERYSTLNATTYDKPSSKSHINIILMSSNKTSFFDMPYIWNFN